MLINMLFVKIYFFNGRYWFLFLCLREAYDSFFGRMSREKTQMNVQTINYMCFIR